MMRTRARGVCNVPGCWHLNPCAEHARKPWANSNRRSRLPKDWPAIRAQVLERDGHRCTNCGAAANQVDHIIRGDNHALANLTTLCAAHHAAKSGREGAAAKAARKANPIHPGIDGPMPPTAV